MENIVTTLIESAFTFAGVLVGTLWANKNLSKKVDRLGKHDQEQYLSILRLTVMNRDMPISERIIAGDKYVKEGGNGDVKKYYQELLKTHTK